MRRFECGEQRYIAKFCKKQQKPEKTFLSESRRTTQRDSQNLVEEKNIEEDYFSFFQTTKKNLENDLYLDS